MIEVTGNLWTYPADYRVITTNGARRSSDGCAIMGRGCAREAATKYPELPILLGNRIRKQGNHVHFFKEWSLFTFPVKHHWQEPADLGLIARSIVELYRLSDDDDQYVYLLPRPGCGNGGLPWDHVRPLLLDLPDNFKVIDFPATVQGGA